MLKKVKYSSITPCKINWLCNTKKKNIMEHMDHLAQLELDKEFLKEKQLAEEGQNSRMRFNTILTSM